MSVLPPTGAVLGIDVGFAATRPTTCFCLLAWNESQASLNSCITGSAATDRAAAISRLCGGRSLAAVALDGPLVSGLVHARHYRVAEAILSRGVLQKRGKPGQTSAPTGQQLHAHATALAKQALDLARIEPASHWEPIHEKRIVEAFPNIFLAALIDEDRLPALARDASDRYWEVVVQPGAPNSREGTARPSRLEQLFRHLLPERDLRADLTQCGNHETRAGVICALTALCVAAGEHVAVGDIIDGDIMLPPRATWGRSPVEAGPWLEPVLRANVRAARVARRAHPNHMQGRVATAAGLWFS